MIARHPEAHLCEPGLIRSPDGREIAVLLRENNRRFNSFVIFSPDEGPYLEPADRVCRPRSPATGTSAGTRRTAASSSRSATRRRPVHGEATGWAGWGRYEDLRRGSREPWAGEARVRLMDNRYAADTAYPGLELLPDGTFVTTTYGHFTPGEEPWIATVRFTTARTGRGLIGGAD